MTLNKKILFRGWFYSVLFSSIIAILLFSILSLIGGSHTVSFNYILRVILGTIFISPLTILPISMLCSLIGIFVAIGLNKIARLSIFYLEISSGILAFAVIFFFTLLSRDVNYSIDFIVGSLTFIASGMFGGYGFWYGVLSACPNH